MNLACHSSPGKDGVGLGKYQCSRDNALDLRCGLEVELTDLTDELRGRDHMMMEGLGLEQLGRWKCHLLRSERFEKEQICRGGHKDLCPDLAVGAVG